MDQDIATPARDEAPATDGRWRAYALFAGDALDGVVERAVGAAVEHARPARWAFVRWTGERGPHVRLALAGVAPDAGLDAILEAGIRSAPAAPARRPLLPAPASWRGTTHAGVEAIELGPGEEPDHPLHEVSSRVVIDALAQLRDGHARAAHALSLMAATSADADPDGFWHGVAAGWTGTDARGRKLLARLAAKADELGPDLRRRARAVREDGPLASGLKRYAAACRELTDPDSVRHHAHMTANRIGVSPLEEALIALALAAAEPASRPPRPGVDSVTRSSESACPAPPPGDGQAGAATVCDGEASVDPSVRSLTPGRGETVALLGPAGAGKTALLSAVGARHRSASLAGGWPGVGPAADEASGASPDGELATESTVRENIELRLRLAASEAGADALLEHAALGARAGVLVADLDPGDRRRLSIACALASDPELLLLDEPSAGLSAIDREAVWQLLARRRAAGGATLLATTSILDALCACDRAAIVRDGKVVAVAEPAELAEEHFPRGSLHVRVREEPDRALLEDLPDVLDVRIDERVDHWVVELETRQPEELRELLRADPEFPEIADVPG